MRENELKGAAVPSGENAVTVSNVVGYVESGSYVDARTYIINVNVNLKGFAELIGKFADAVKGYCTTAVASIGRGLARLFPNEWHLSFSIGRCANTSAPRLN